MALKATALGGLSCCGSCMAGRSSWSRTSAHAPSWARTPWRSLPLDSADLHDHGRQFSTARVSLPGHPRKLIPPIMNHGSHPGQQTPSGPTTVWRMLAVLSGVQGQQKTASQKAFLANTGVEIDFWVRVTPGARGSVSVGFWEAHQLSPFWGRGRGSSQRALSTPPPPGNESPRSPGRSTLASGTVLIGAKENCAPGWNSHPWGFV